MAVRMWRTSGPLVSVEGKKGFFGIRYGQESDAQELDVWLPEGQGPFPVILNIHGGGYIACDKRQTDMLLPMLTGLDRGYAVVSMNYRLSGETQFPNPVKDIKQAIRFIRANAKDWHLDADKIVVWGGSAGGYFALMASLFENDTAFDNPNDPNLALSAAILGAVAWYPQTDFQTCDQELKINHIVNQQTRKEILDVHEEYSPVFDMADEGDFPFHDGENSLGAKFLGADPLSEIGTTASPIHRIHAEMKPVFIQHGMQDQIVPYQQSIRFMLKANEICGEERVKLELHPYAIHSSVLFETEENVAKVLAFFDNLTK